MAIHDSHGKLIHELCSTDPWSPVLFPFPTYLKCCRGSTRNYKNENWIPLIILSFFKPHFQTISQRICIFLHVLLSLVNFERMWSWPLTSEEELGGEAGWCWWRDKGRGKLPLSNALQINCILLHSQLFLSIGCTEGWCPRRITFQNWTMNNFILLEEQLIKKSQQKRRTSPSNFKVRFFVLTKASLAYFEDRHGVWKHLLLALFPYCFVFGLVDLWGKLEHLEH